MWYDLVFLGRSRLLHSSPHIASQLGLACHGGSLLFTLPNVRVLRQPCFGLHLRVAAASQRMLSFSASTLFLIPYHDSLVFVAHIYIRYLCCGWHHVYYFLLVSLDHVVSRSRILPLWY
jgi:hypothetical protein